MLNRKITNVALVTLVFVMSVFSISLVSADDYTSSSFILRDPVISAEGGESSSTTFQYISSGGQLAPGESLSSSFIYRAGFLYFPAGSVVVNPGGGGGGGGGGGSSSGGSIIPGQYPVINQCNSALLTDLNCDNKVDIVDLSIFLYYADRTYIARYDFNQDGKINLVDISILLYYWT
jgi:hypothetical protein